MTDRVEAVIALRRWQGDRGAYHLVSIEGEPAEAIAMHERLRRLEFGARRGFGSVKVMARIGETLWKTSVFPQKSSSSSKATGRPEREWILLVSKKIMRAEDLAEGDTLKVEMELL